MPWGVAAAAIGAAGSIYGASQQKKAAKGAAERETAASGEALERQEAAYRDAQAMLNPYVRQEQAASSQLMAQMGMGGGAGGAGAPATMGGGWGFQDPATLTSASGEVSGLDRFMQDLVRDQIAISGRAGYGSNTKPDKAIAEGSRRTVSFLNQLKKQGKLPADYQIPTMEDLNRIGAEQVQAGGGLKALGRSGAAGGKQHPDYGIEDVTGVYDQYFPEGYESAQGGIAKPGGPGGMVGDATMLEGGGAGGGAGGAMTAGDIMGLAGVEDLPPEFRDQYFEDVTGAGQPIDMGFGTDFRDEEFQGYMGLTPESMEVGSTYQDSPAYAAAREQGMRAVNQGSAGTGTLYSGRRGEALRDVGQDVEQRYYFDAANRRADMMGARRQTYGAELARRLAEREADLARRGGIYQAGKNREQSYYNNYMQLLSGMAQPSTTTNLASMGTNLGRESAANLMGTARNVSDLKIGAAGAEQAAMADVMGGLVNLGSAYIGRDAA